jgi:hypothetical protein
MILALAWKENREQSTIWLAMAALSAGAVALLTQFVGSQAASSNPFDAQSLAALSPLALISIYGLVCGAMLLAGEQEAGTQTFLDTLPALRRQLWFAKLLSGAALVVLQALLLAGVAYGLGLRAEALRPEQWFWILPAAGLEALAWGMLGSALCSSVLAAVVLSAVLLFGIWGILTPPGVGPILLVLPRGSLTLGALIVSLLVFARTDRDRRAAPPLASGAREKEAGAKRKRGRRQAAPGLGTWRVLPWLALRQGWAVILLFAAASFLLGLVLPNSGPLFWPAATLLVGIGCGAAVFLAEQARGSYRFLGDQRFPFGRVWLGKVGFWLAVALACTLLVLLGALLHFTIIRTAHGREAAPPGTGWQLWKELLFGNPERGRTTLLFAGLWLLNGFSVGQLCALVWRKSVVAVFMALALGVTASTVWLPSLFGGGLPAWHVYVVPVLLLAASRLALRAWVSDRLHTWRPLAGLALCGLLAAAWTVGSLAYRVVEVPDAGEPFDVAAFSAALPTPEENVSGRLIRQALTHFKDREAEVARQSAPAVAGGGAPGGPPGMAGGIVGRQAPEVGGPGGVPVPAAPPPPPLSRQEQVDRVRDRGWQAATPDLGRWLDQMFQQDVTAASAAAVTALPAAGPGGAWATFPLLLDLSAAPDWSRELRTGAAGPLGLIEDPRHVTLFTRMESLEQCRWAAALLTARALQLQARGEDQEALDHLLTVLALSRQLRHKAIAASWLVGTAVERMGLEGLGRWLEHPSPLELLLERMNAWAPEGLGRWSEHPGPRPELVRKALVELGRHEEAQPQPGDVVKAEYLVLRNNLDDPTLLARMYASSSGEPQPSIEAVNFSLQMPTEKARALRIVNAVYAGWLQAADADFATVAAQAPGDARGGRAQWVEQMLLGEWLPGRGPDAALSRAELARFVEQSWMVNLISAEAWRMSPCLTHANSLARVRGTRLQLALALYEMEEGKPAPVLEVLSPRTLLDLPRDPFNGQPFHYRVSEGESILWRPQATDEPDRYRKVPPGWGIVWSVGPDQVDSGGVAQGTSDSWRDVRGSGRNFDMIFLVPRWAR